ncbi:MAG: hypothetical protein AB1752_01085 [Candidatus Zixiibacteriota bacterium]
MKTRPIFSLILIVSLSPAVSRATPQLAARYAQDCGLCHVNPTGGGLRNSYASQYILPAELSLRPLPAHEREHWPNPRLNDFISVGIDMRSLYFAESRDIAVEGKAARAGHGPLRLSHPTGVAAGAHEGHGTNQEGNSFFQMQGDLYVSFEPDPSFAIYLDKGLYDGFEAFLLARILPSHGYIKAGQLVPDIGWRWDDHNRLTRVALNQDYRSGRVTEAGLEFGINPGQFAISAGVYNGSASATFDDNSQKMVTGRVLYRARIGGVHAALGGSARLNRGNLIRERVLGGQAQAAIGPRLTYIADAFAIHSEDVTGALSDVSSMVMSHELDIQLKRGLDAYVGYDFHDPDLDVESGTHTLVSFGARVYARHFLQIQPVVRWEEIGDDTVKRFELILHGFY